MNVISFDYDSTFFPSAPFLEIEVDGYSDNSRTLWAMLDSGADATMIPLRVLRAIQASYKETRWLRGTAGGRLKVDMYLISVRIGNLLIPGIHAIATSSNEAIVGRDVLNQLVVTLNGLANTTTVNLE